jgi:hypothetical protein
MLQQAALTRVPWLAMSNSVTSAEISAYALAWVISKPSHLTRLRRTMGQDRQGLATPKSQVWIRVSRRRQADE